MVGVLIGYSSILFIFCVLLLQINLQGSISPTITVSFYQNTQLSAILRQFVFSRQWRLLLIRQRLHNEVRSALPEHITEKTQSGTERIWSRVQHKHSSTTADFLRIFNRTPPCVGSAKAKEETTWTALSALKEMPTSSSLWSTSWYQQIKKCNKKIQKVLVCLHHRLVVCQCFVYEFIFAIDAAITNEAMSLRSFWLRYDAHGRILLGCRWIAMWNKREQKNIVLRHTNISKLSYIYYLSSYKLQSLWQILNLESWESLCAKWPGCFGRLYHGSLRPLPTLQRDPLPQGRCWLTHIHMHRSLKSP